MLRGLVHGVVAALTVVLAVAHTIAADSTGPPPILQRFLSIDGPPPTQFRALRHLDAENDHFDTTAWMDVWTEADGANGFRYEIVGEGGSEYIRHKVFMPTLDGERKMWPAAAAEHTAFTSANYVFEDRGQQSDGLASVGLKPRRKDLLLVDGSIFLRPEDGDLVRLEGRLSKSPSFWTRRVEIVRRFQRFVGIRMPVALESVANILIAGRSTFRMMYEYETVNGQRVGNPQPRPLTARAASLTPP